MFLPWFAKIVKTMIDNFYSFVGHGVIWYEHIREEWVQRVVASSMDSVFYVGEGMVRVI